MINLKEYKTTPKRLCDRLLWALLLEDGVVLNKNGSLQRTVRYRGPDLDSAEPTELVATVARLNNLLRRFGSGWAIFSECQKREVAAYPDSIFANASALLIDEERRASYEESQSHFDTHYYLTLVYMPPPDTQQKLGKLFLTDRRERKQGGWWSVIDQFKQQTDRFFQLLDGVVLEVNVLTDEHVLTYLHSTVSDKYHKVAMPECSMYLDSFLTDSPYIGGLAPKLGEHHLRVITIRLFPNDSYPGILHELNNLPFEFRYCCRYIALDKHQASSLFESYSKKWFQKRKGFMGVLREAILKEPSAVVNSAAETQGQDAEAVRHETELDLVSQGYFTATVVVMDKDLDAVEEKAKTIEKVINSRQFTTIYERMNASEAYLGSLPGNCYANVRKPIINSLNLSHIMPVSSIWSGFGKNEHLNAPPLMVADTSGSMPFNVSFHHGELGHLMVIGPTRSGKTFFINLCASQFMRYENAHVVHFDKDLGGYVACLAHGGAHYRLSARGGVALQPLGRIDDTAECSWAAGWLHQLLQHVHVAVTPRVKQEVWSALTNLATKQPASRTLSNFCTIVQNKEIKMALQPFLKGGAYGELFDGDRDDFRIQRWLHFEMGELLNTPEAIDPALMYLFHRLDQHFDDPEGPPVFFPLDEGWLYLENSEFTGKIREWLKTKAKKNVSVLFSTQSLADASNSPIIADLIESCPTKIYLPNVNALDSLTYDQYRGFGLNHRQIQLIASATPRQDYYYTSPAGNRLFSLNAGPVTKTLCGAGSKPDIVLADRIVEQHGKDVFAARFLGAKGLDWAAELLGLPQNSQPIVNTTQTKEPEYESEAAM